MAAGEYKKIKLHLYRKSVQGISSFNGTNHQLFVYIDNAMIGEIRPGETKLLDITPGLHTIVLKSNGLFISPSTKQFEVSEDSTDVFVIVRGVLARYMGQRILDIAQYNSNLINLQDSKNVQLTVHNEYDFRQKSDWLRVNIDGTDVAMGNYNIPDLRLNITAGKHIFTFESKLGISCSCIDIPSDCDSVYIPLKSTFDRMEVLCVFCQNKANENDQNIKQVDCIISRLSTGGGKLAGMKVTIDQNIVLNLKYGESTKIKISTGKHLLMTFGGVIPEAQIFDVPENCNTVYITSVIKLSLGQATAKWNSEKDKMVSSISEIRYE